MKNDNNVYTIELKKLMKEFGVDNGEDLMKEIKRLMDENKEMFDTKIPGTFLPIPDDDRLN